MNLNKVLLIGRLTREPELRHTPSGSPVCELGLAINRNWTGQDGQKHQEATFLEVTFWAKQAEVVTQYLHKGDPLFVEGRLQLDQWSDGQTGDKRSKLRVICERMQFVGRRTESPTPEPPQEAFETASVSTTDEVPF